MARVMRAQLVYDVLFFYLDRSGALGSYNMWLVAFLIRVNILQLMVGVFLFLSLLSTATALAGTTQYASIEPCPCTRAAGVCLAWLIFQAQMLLLLYMPTEFSSRSVAQCEHTLFFYPQPLPRLLLSADDAKPSPVASALVISLADPHSASSTPCRFG